MADWTDNVPLVVDGETPFSASGLNPTINALISRTLNLKERLDNFKGNYGLVYSDTGFDTVNHTINKGTIVAFVNGLYVPAKASWSPTPRSDGSSSPAPESYIVGVLTSDVVNNYATILSYGCITDPALITAILGNSPTSGQYFLGSDGKLYKGTDNATDLPIYCLTYCTTGTGAGKIVFNPKTPEFSGHSHASAELPFAGWTISGGTSTFVATSAFPGLVSLLGSTLTGGYLSQNGIGVDPDLWSIQGNTITTSFPVFANDRMIFFAISPMQGKDPVVHSITIDNTTPLLKAENYSGNVVLSLSTEPASTNTYKGSAVIEINGGTIATGPVVQQIVAGPGTTLTSSQQNPGVVTVGVAAYDQRQIDMVVTNLDGVLFGTDNNLPVVYKFPASVTSKLHGTFRVPHFDGGYYTAELNLVFYGTGQLIPEMAAQLQLFQFPAAGSSIVPSVPVVAYSDSISSTTSGHWYRVNIDLTDIIPIYSDALITCSIYPSGTPNSTVTMLSASLQLKPLEA